jgi:hypothetical protein
MDNKQTTLKPYIKNGIIGLVLAFGVVSCNNKMIDAEDGREYLQDKGYT